MIVTGQNCFEAGEVNGFNAVIVATSDSGGHGKCIEDGLFGGLDRRCKERIQMGIGQVCQIVSRLFRVVRNHVGCGEGQDEIPAAVAHGGAGPGETERGTFGQSGELSTIQGCIGGNDDDDGAFALARRERFRDLLRRIIEFSHWNATNHQFRPSSMVRIDQDPHRIAAFFLGQFSR